MKKSALLEWLRGNVLLIATLFGVIIGVIAGILLGRFLEISRSGEQILAYPGEIFTRALQMMILPLIISSLIVGSASLNARMNGKMALRTLSYFVVTSVMNAVLGVAFATLIHPGHLTSKEKLETGKVKVEERPNTLLDNFLDLGRNLVPSNILTAAFEQVASYTPFFILLTSAQTVYETTGTGDFVPVVKTQQGTNTMGIIIFSLVFGSVLGGLGEKGRPLVEGFRIMDQVIMTIISTLMWLTPVGVASLIASKIVSLDNAAEVTSQLGLFVVTVVAGVLTYQLIVQQLIYALIKRKNPYVFYAGMIEAVITGFSTASTAVALPITFRCIEKQGLDPRIAHFVLPIGATVNKDGTALFVAAASLFICQMNGIDVGPGEVFTIIICSTCVSIASASVPSAALALMFIVLNSIGAPTEDIGLLFAVDWLVDRVRTTNNLLGDCYATAIVEHFSKKELLDMDSPAAQALATDKAPDEESKSQRLSTNLII